MIKNIEKQKAVKSIWWFSNNNLQLEAHLVIFIVVCIRSSLVCNKKNVILFLKKDSMLNMNN